MTSSDFSGNLFIVVFFFFLPLLKTLEFQTTDFSEVVKSIGVFEMQFQVSEKKKIEKSRDEKRKKESRKERKKRC